MQKSTTVTGYIRAIADQTHPLQTKLSLILTDFEPNGNRQGVPLSEKDNILKTAMYMPLKINFNGESFAGHTGAFPIGPIVNVYEGEDNGRAVIYGEAIIWNEVYNDVAEHLRIAFSEGVGTSWEIYYDDSTSDENGVQWLNGCVFAATAIVEVPAYGPNRTRVLAIAEALNNRVDTLNTLEVNQTMAAKEKADSTDMEETRNDLLDTQDLLFKLWEGVDTLFNKTFEIEAAQVENDIGKIASQFAEKLGQIADKIAKLSEANAEKDTALASVTSELETIKQEKAQAEKDALIAERTAKLSEAGLNLQTANSEYYFSLPDDVFSALVNDMLTVRGAKATSESTKTPDVIPEPLGATNNDITDDDLKIALKEAISTKR